MSKSEKSPKVNESTNLDEEKQIGILALGGSASTLLDVVGGNVDTLVYEVSKATPPLATTTSSPSWFLAGNGILIGVLPQEA